MRSRNIKKQSGRGAAWLARLNGVQEVGGSNPLAPTDTKGWQKTTSVNPFFLK